MEPHQVVSHDEWIAARKAHLADEKAFTRARDALSRKRRELPWEKIEKNYAFEGPNGKETLAGLFGGKSQLIVYHFMLGPDWEEGCPSCSLLADHFDGSVVHLAQRDVAFVVVSRAPLDKIEKFKRRMGWHFKWVSSFGTDFNFDYQVSATPEEKAKGIANYNYAETAIPERRAAGHQRVLQERRRRGVPHLFELWARSRPSDRRLQFPRHRTQRPRRRGSALRHGVGAPPRQIRGRGGRSGGPLSGAQIIRRIGVFRVVLRLNSVTAIAGNTNTRVKHRFIRVTIGVAEEDGKPRPGEGQSNVD